ncbi:MAG: methylated-DNA--[protein]-cysteine S-methyltransferase [Verrucomicrobiae bacterium]|nr:methylated-DNA--[protein]-cysteine S-methyltransferase [Verrucomicrobiae bacterium]
MASVSGGLCVLRWNDDRRRTRGYLERVFPEIAWEEDERPLREWRRQLDAFLKGASKKFDPPLVLRPTPFQGKIWRLLRQIPYGQTISYRELAARAGCPKSVRAAANACGQNPVAVAIPCHRVVRGNGTPGGFSSGLQRKQALLELEDMEPRKN